MDELKASIACSALAGLGVLTTFTVWHWFRIAPVPSVFVEGLVHVALASLALGWAHAELRRAGRFRAGRWRGPAFGLMLWSPLPLFLVEGWLIGPQGATTAPPPVERLPLLLTLAALGLPWGLASGAALTRRLRPSIALGLALLLLHLFLGGFAMFTGGSRLSQELVLVLLPAEVLAGWFIVAGSERFATPPL